MPPKKKANKKGADDWENELGESVEASSPPKEDDAAPVADDDDGAASGGMGGLMAAIKKNKSKKQKKGKVVEDFVEGEDPPTARADGADGDTLLLEKAPEEAVLDDEDFVSRPKKGKPGSAKNEDPRASPAPDEGDEGGGHLKSKKEKEKEKKEREKQRKKEQV